MSRSRRRTPKVGITTARSEKQDKLQAHRDERRKVKVALAQGATEHELPHRREVSDPWLMAKDGKAYLGRKADPRDLRK